MSEVYTIHENISSNEDNIEGMRSSAVHTRAQLQCIELKTSECSARSGLVGKSG